MPVEALGLVELAPLEQHASEAVVNLDRLIDLAQRSRRRGGDGPCG
jgi:hypothetical protein